LKKTMNDKEMDDYVEELKEFVVDTKTGEKVHQEMYKQRIKDLASRGSRMVDEKKCEEELNDFFVRANLDLDNIFRSCYQ